LTQAGSGTSILTNANTYTGVTTVSAGTLQLGDGTSGHDGTLVSASLVNNGALVYNRFGSVSYGGVISGTGTVTKLGAGTQTLTGTNTYTGDTTISAGTLTLADNAQLKFKIKGTGVNNTITGSGTLNLDGDFLFDLTEAGTGLIDSWQIVDVATLTENFGATFSVTSTLGSFTKSGALWKIQENGTWYQFLESTGVLSAMPRGTLISIF